MCHLEDLLPSDRGQEIVGFETDLSSEAVGRDLRDGEGLTKVLPSRQTESPRLVRVLEEGEVDQVLPHVDGDLVIRELTEKSWLAGHSLPSIWRGVS